MNVYFRGFDFLDTLFFLLYSPRNVFFWLVFVMFWFIYRIPPFQIELGRWNKVYRSSVGSGCAFTRLKFFSIIALPCSPEDVAFWSGFLIFWVCTSNRNLKKWPNILFNNQSNTVIISIISNSFFFLIFQVIQLNKTSLAWSITQWLIEGGGDINKILSVVLEDH